MSPGQIVTLAAVALAPVCGELRAQSLFWDTNPATAGAQGGTGNWIGTNFWFDGANNQPWVDNRTPSFGGTAGTVTVNSGVVAGGMAFTASGYTITGASAVTLATPVIDVANPVLDSFAEIRAPIGGSVGLVKNGPGILILGGAPANTFTGTTVVNDGALHLNKTGANAINGDLVIGNNLGGAGSTGVLQFASNQIPDAAKVTVNADAVWTSFNQSETIGTLEFNGGRVQFEPPATLTVSAVQTIANSATALLNGRVDLGGAVRTFQVANGTAATDLSLSPVVVGTDGLFNGGVLKLGAGTLELTGTNTFNTLQINGGAISVPDVANAGVASPLGAGSGMSLDGGTLIFTGTTADSMNRAITLNSGGGTFQGTAALQRITLSGVISGPGGLTKAGPGALLLTGTNTFTGPVAINGSFIEIPTVTNIGVPGPLGAGSSISFNGGAIIISAAGNHVTNRPITLGPSPITLGPGGSTFELSGPISGIGGIATTSSGVLLLSGNNTFSGNIFVSSSIVRVANGNGIPNTAEVFLGTGAGTPRGLDLNNSNETIGSLRGGDATSGNVTLGSGTLTTGADNTSKSYAGTISGSGGLTKIGTGTQTFTGSSTFTGPVTINGGTISVADVTDSGAAGPLGAGNTINFDQLGTLELTASDSTDRLITLGAGGGRVRITVGGTGLTLNGVISGPGPLHTSGFVIPRAANTFTGALVIESSILSVPSVANSGVPSPIGAGNSIIINGASLFLSGFATHSTNRAVTINGGASLSPGNGTVTYSGPITGTGGLGITGPGFLVLSGTNTFSGNVSVTNSTLRIANGNAIPDTATVSLSTVNSPAGFDVNSSNETIGSLAGGSATTGAITLGSGTLTIGANNASTSYDGVISGTGSIVKIGSGTLTLSRTGTFTGGVAIERGEISVSDVADSGVNSPLGAGNNLTLGATDTQGILVFTGAANDSFNRPVTLNGSGGGFSVTNAATTLTVSGAITGPGVLTKSGVGTLLLSGTNTYSGITSLFQGTLRVAGGNAIGNNSAVLFTGPPGVVLDLNNTDEVIGSLAGIGPTGGAVTLGSGTLTTGGNNTSTNFGGVISGTGGVTKTGTGTLTLTGTNTYSGTTTVSAGKLQFSGGNALNDASPLIVSANATAEFLAGSETIASLTGDGDVIVTSGTLGIGASNSSTTFNGIISGPGNLSKVGTGALTLSSAPTHTGATNILAGTLTLNAGFDSAGGGLSVSPGATLMARNAVSRAVSGTGRIIATVGSPGTELEFAL